MVEHQINFIFVPPSFGKKNELCTLNNVTKWFKFAKTKLKDNFKLDLSEWSLPPWEDNPYTKADIEYTILRKDGKKIDSDNLAFSYKWLQDLLVDQNYLIDDDKVKVVLNPTQLHVEGSVETSVSCNIKLYRRFEMTIDELKITVRNLALELENVGSENHIKAASGRVRKMLGEIKNATPELRKALVALDK